MSAAVVVATAGGAVDARDKSPATPRDPSPMSLSQPSLPSTEAPASPADAGQSLRTEPNDDRAPSSSVVPSSLTPPPSSQLPTTNGHGAVGKSLTSQRPSILSPPVTGLNTVRREAKMPVEYVAPEQQQIDDAPPDELREMLRASVAEQGRLKMEAAHHKLQYNLLSLQAGEDARQAAVEHDLIRREVDALKSAELSRQARRQLSSPDETMQVKYNELLVKHQDLFEVNVALGKKLKAARKIIQQKEDQIDGLQDERGLLLNRIRENREHFNQLRSPGGIFHNAVTPKASPVQHRPTPRETPRHANNRSKVSQVDRDRSQEPFATLLHVVNQENNSAPSTPITSSRPAPRLPAVKHTRGVQSMSSLPTTPTNTRARGPSQGGLLPSVDLVPQTEPAPRYGSRTYVPETPGRGRDHSRKSRESTISAEDEEEPARQAHQNEELARLALSFASRATESARPSYGSRRPQDEEVFESQASQAASEMLRRDPRESFEVASSTNSRDATPAPAAAEKTAKLQARLFAPVNKASTASTEKRKYREGPEVRDDVRREALTSPTKRLRLAGGLREGASLVGLGIHD